MRTEISQTTTSGILEIAASTQTHIERLKSRVAELEKRLYGSRVKVHQVMAEMKPSFSVLYTREISKLHDWRMKNVHSSFR